jgi:hypothetical protein
MMGVLTDFHIHIYVYVHTYDMNQVRTLQFCIREVPS